MTQLWHFYDAVLNLETMKCLVLVCSTLLLLFAFSCDHIHELCARFCSFVNGYQRADLHVNRKKIDFESQTAAFHRTGVRCTTVVVSQYQFVGPKYSCCRRRILILVYCSIHGNYIK